jgi:hypothetical protein
MSFGQAHALALEFNVRSEPQLELASWLTNRGVDVAHAWNVAGTVLEHDIMVFPMMMFDFAERGARGAVRAVVHVVHGEDAETPIDLVAWTRNRPDKVFRCLGSAHAIAIDQLINSTSYFVGRALHVHRTPLNWLAAGCNGLVPLDHRAVRDRLVRYLHFHDGPYNLAAENLAHGRALRAALSPLPSRVKILVPRAEAA